LTAITAKKKERLFAWRFSPGTCERKGENCALLECQTLISKSIIMEQVRHENDKTVPRFYACQPTPPYGVWRKNEKKITEI
jgi:hypothetical protein